MKNKIIMLLIFLTLVSTVTAIKLHEIPEEITAGTFESAYLRAKLNLTQRIYTKERLVQQLIDATSEVPYLRKLLEIKNKPKLTGGGGSPVPEPVVVQEEPKPIKGDYNGD